MPAKKSNKTKEESTPCNLESLTGDWDFTPAPPKTLESRRPTRAAVAGGLPDFLSGDEFDVLVEGELEAGAERRSGESTSSQIQLAAEVPDDADVILMLRHPSGAFTFHKPGYAPARRSAATATGSTRVMFEVSLQPSATVSGRRGPISKLIKVILVKVADGAKKLLKERVAEWAGDGVYEFVVPKLAVKLEELMWKKTARTRGWLKVSASGLASKTDQLRTGKPTPSIEKRILLLIHGTFSTAHGGFKNLAKTAFFQKVSPLYGDNIYAFNHFTISKTPADNVKEMLDELPDGDYTFDIVTHSRGGLVARELLEGSGREHPKFRRLKIGNVIMVACPSDGTPLADFDTWEKRLSYLANVFDMLPDSPFTTGPAWIAEMLKWLAGNIIGNFPGLTSMTPGGDYLRQLQGGPAEPEGTGYHAIVSNFHPSGKWTARLADLGVDQFFSGANDLVVPTEGGWKTSDDTSDWIPGNRIACFGKGGNVGTELSLTHGDFFGNESAVEFIISALQGRPGNLPVVNTLADLPSRHLRATRGLTRPGALDAAVTEVQVIAPSKEVVAVMPTGSEAGPGSWIDPTGWADDDTLYLTLISSVQEDEFHKDRQVTILLLAQYGSARVAQPFYTRNTKGKDDDQNRASIWTDEQMKVAGTRFQEIIGMQKDLVNYTNGQKIKRKPDDAFVRELGEKLFEVLFSGQVRRLYDAAIYSHRNKELNIVFTSMVSWLSDLPWEMCYDPGYKGFLSISNVRFLRNVLTPTPAERVIRKRGKLHILVASAQAVGASFISNEEETQRIKDSFGVLVQLGLVELEVMVRCTPEMLHGNLRCAMDEREYDVLHFIGHGKYDEEHGGMVEFEKDDGESHELTAAQLSAIVRSRGIRVVFLNACETGRGFGNSGSGKKEEASNYNKGVAVKLAEEGIPAVVANQYSVVDQLASLFSLHFYSCLAHGLSVSDAMREARIAVCCSEDAEPMDWGVPVLFARNPHATLCKSRPYDAVVASSAIQRNAASITRRGGEMERMLSASRRKIAIWCTSPALSYREDLNLIIQDLQDVQQEFDFSIRKRRIPAHFFNRDKSKGYLSADTIIEHLKDMCANTFKADMLFCITDQPLMSSQTEALYYYSWENVVIFSVWGFDPPLRGSDFRAGLSNHIAISLLEHVAGVSTGCEHNDDPNNPIHTIGYFNDERSVEHIAGRMEIMAQTQVQIDAAIRSKTITKEQYDAILEILYFHQPADA